METLTPRQALHFAVVRRELKCYTNDLAEVSQNNPGTGLVNAGKTRQMVNKPVML